MKKNKIGYWIFTVLLCALMLFSAIPGLTTSQGSIDVISTQLGYPKYIIPFLSVAKLLAVVAILVPGFPRLKEWAYAGLTFDLLGAWYSSIAIGTPVAGWIFFVLFLALVFGSYFFYHRIKAGVPTPAYAR
jgi:hypothetical protein